jgi:SPP1 family predicted phage head-tail adaptor
MSSGASQAGEITILAGEMRRRITIQQRVTSPDEFGGAAVAWVDFAYCWAYYEPLHGSELYAAQQVYPETDTRFSIRYRSGLDPSMRIVDQNGVQFDVTGIVDVDQRHFKLVVTAVRRPGGRAA